MTSYFNSSFQTTTTTPLPPPITSSSALNALHNHSLMIELNPLVVSHRPLSSCSQSADNKASNGSAPTYLITDKLPIPLWPTTVSYTASFENTASGVKTKVHAPMGLEISGEWDVYDGDNARNSSDGKGEGGAGGPMLRERTTVSCNALLMPYVRATLGKSHKELHKRFVEKLLET